MQKRSFSRIEIKSRDLENGSAFTEVYIDGHKVRGVRSFKLEQKVGNDIPTLTLDLNAIATTVDEPVLIFADGFGEMEINFKDYEEAGEKNE